MKEKVVLLTGATEGLGKAAARALASLGATLVLVGRNAAKTQTLQAELQTSSGNARVESIIADLSVQSGVRSAAQEFLRRHDRLDVLANNAGGLFTDYGETADGIEQTFALNHLSYFLLTHLLRDTLGRTDGARVVSTASAAHRQGRLDNLERAARNPDKRAGLRAYGDSKLANILFTRELARRLSGTGVIANCFHPGFVATGLGQNNGGALGWAMRAIAPYVARTPEKGAETLLWLATSSDAAAVTGEYFVDCRVQKTSARGRDMARAADLWRFSETLCGLVPNVSGSPS
jgi:NAD(P)-dependent dehydrogenase (short-subunit alcohol dehydrogenase family)